jgi:hypothetical protein
MAVEVPVLLPVPGAARAAEVTATPDDCECIAGRRAARAAEDTATVDDCECIAGRRAALVSEDTATPDDCECISGRGGPSRTSFAYATTVISLRTLVPLANGRGHG